MYKRLIKILPVIITGVLVLLITVCEPPEQPYGRLTITLALGKSGRAESHDFSQVESGKVFLKQGGSTIMEGNIELDKPNMTGTCTLTLIKIGSYDIIVELYESQGHILYSGEDTVTIVQGDNGVKTIIIERHIGSLTITGTWTEDVSGLEQAVARLEKAGTVMYERQLGLNTGAKTVNGALLEIYPDDYILNVEIQDTGGPPVFSGTQAVTIHRGSNGAVIALLLKTGSIQIVINGDGKAPSIASGPGVTINGTSAAITWITDEPATSNICYSETQGFDYNTTRSWAPVKGDLEADTTHHSVTIEGLSEGATYYYVIFTADAAGNVLVSDEGSFVVEEITWVEVQEVPTPEIGHRIVFLNGFVYRIGGNYYNSVVERYNVSNNIWETCADMNYNHSHFAVGVINGKIYVAGGFMWTSASGGAEGNSVEEYDPISNQWSPKRDMTTTRSCPGYGVIDNKLYVAGGETPGDGTTNVLEIYNPETDKWYPPNTPTPSPMPEPRRNTMSAVIDGKLYITGGNRSDNQYYDIIVYDAAADNWVERIDMPCKMYGGITIAYKQYIFLIGGINHETGETLNTVYVYDTGEGIWSECTPLPAPRVGMGGCLIPPDILFIVSGGDGNEIVDTVYKGYINF
jgi:hypothetical protein